MKNIAYKNIKNVVKMEDESFLCTVDIDLDNTGVFETVEYCARVNGGGLCNYIIEDIKNKKFKGNIDVDVKKNNPINILEEEKKIRNIRNKKLQDTDWTQLRDIPKKLQEKWAKYRQELRDLTNQPDFPLNVMWPKKPD